MDAPKQQMRLKVVLLSLPARTQAVLEFFFTSTGRTSFAPVAQDQADAAIFDLDTLESRQHWLEFHGRTGRPGIALSVQPQEVGGAVWVRKPVTPAALLAAAADIHAERWVKPAPAITEAVPEPIQMTAAAPIALLPADPASVSDPAATARDELDRALAQMPANSHPVAEPTPAVPPAETVPQAAVAVAAPKVQPTPVRDEATAAPRAVVDTTAALPSVSTRPALGASTPLATPPTVPSPTPTPTASVTTNRPARLGGFGGMLRRLFGGQPTPEPRGGRADVPHARALAPSVASKAPPAIPAVPATSTQPVAPVPAPAPVELVVAPLGATQPPPAAAAQPPLSTVSGDAAVAQARPAEPVRPVAPGLTPALPAEAPEEPPQLPAADSQPAETPAPNPETAAPAPDADLSSAVRQRLLGGTVAAAAANEALLCGLRDDVAADQLSEDPELRYDPDVHLVSAMREAYLVGIKWQVPTQLDCSAGRIVVDPTRNLLLCDFEAGRLESILATPLGKRPKTRTLNRQEQAEVQQHAPHEQGVRRLDDLLWRAGLLTAGGRLPVDSDPNRPVYLRHWPNLTRISAIPHAVRIAALWSARGASLVETAALLGIPQRNVIAFYNGALALDLITEDGSHIRRAQRKAGRNRGLLTRLLGWLHR